MKSTTIRLHPDTKEFIEQLMSHDETYDQYIRKLAYKINGLVRYRHTECPNCGTALIYLDTDDFWCAKCDEYFEPRELKPVSGKTDKPSDYVRNKCDIRKWS